MDFIIYNSSLYPPVVIVTDTDWVYGKFRKKKTLIFVLFNASRAMNISMWRYYSVTWVLSENILLWYILYQKPWKFLNSKKVDFFIKVGKIDFENNKSK
jgi:hypothetical protein